MTTEEGIEAAEEIVRLIDEEVGEKAHDKAGEFFDDVREQAVAMTETLEGSDFENVTDKQESALTNWEAGVRKWIRD